MSECTGRTQIMQNHFLTSRTMQPDFGRYSLFGVMNAYGYNLRAEVVSSRRTFDGAEVRGFDYDYAYDPIGNRTSATDYDEQGNALVSSYTANALNQYTQRTVPGYAAVRGEAATNATVTVNERPVWRSGSYFYGGDCADNSTSPVLKDLEVYAAINPPGTNTSDVVYASTGTVFVAKTPELFTYDADGNMTSDGRFHYFWNGENRLVMASNDTVVVTYAYDHRGRMVRKVISHRGTEPRRIEYLWDDWNIIRETSHNLSTFQPFNFSTDYVWGLDLDGTLQGAGGVGGLLAVVKSDCAATNLQLTTYNLQLYLPTYDANGNISEYVSTNGEVVAHYDYSPFGEALIETGDLALTFTHRFSTKPWCPITGLYEYQMRKYRSEIGRWMSRDPLTETAAWNIYSFVNNSSITHLDSLGEMMSRVTCPCCCVDKWILVDNGREFDKYDKNHAFYWLAHDNFDAVLSMTFGVGIEDTPCSITWTDGPVEYEYDSLTGWIRPGDTKTYYYSASPISWKQNDQPGLYAYYAAKNFKGNRFRTVKRVLRQTWLAESGKYCDCPRRKVVMKVSITQVLKNGEPVWKEWKLKWH